MPFETKLAFRPYARQAEQFLKDFEQCEKEVIETYGIEQEDGSFTVYPNTPEMTKYLKAYEKLLDTEVKMNVDKFSLDAIGKAKNELSIKDIESLTWIIDFPDETGNESPEKEEEKS
jgi:hypothetical protein